MERARREGFFFGAKLVRGAYMYVERDHARDRGYASPIWDTIEQTHANYDRTVARGLEAVAAHDAEIMIASHNQASVEKAVAAMHGMELDQRQAGVYFGQLLGMADPLSFVLGANGYRVRTAPPGVLCCRTSMVQHPEFLQEEGCFVTPSSTLEIVSCHLKAASWRYLSGLDHQLSRAAFHSFVKLHYFAGGVTLHACAGIQVRAIRSGRPSDPVPGAASPGEQHCSGRRAEGKGNGGR
jgi:hypothetical protein